MNRKPEFYGGLIGTMSLAFFMPLLSSAFEWGIWPFIGYLFMGVSGYFMVHALYLEEKDYLKIENAEEAAEEG